MESNNIYIGFDFSMNKPACTIYYDKKFYFLFWPISLPKSTHKLMEESGVYVFNRNLKSIDTSEADNTQLVLIHTIRSTELANKIIEDIDHYIIDIFSLDGKEYDIYVCSEGLSYSSKGDATLNLATYKGVLLSKIYEHYDEHLKRLFTYSPNTLKSTAGCAGKELCGDKKNMIKAFARESIVNSVFQQNIAAGLFMAKKNYMTGVDDIADSYWALKTMVIKEKLSF